MYHTKKKNLIELNRFDKRQYHTIKNLQIALKIGILRIIQVVSWLFIKLEDKLILISYFYHKHAVEQ